MFFEHPWFSVDMRAEGESHTVDIQSCATSKTPLRKQCKHHSQRQSNHHYYNWNVNVAFQRDIINHVEDGSSQVSGRLVTEMRDKPQNLMQGTREFCWHIQMSDKMFHTCRKTKERKGHEFCWNWDGEAGKGMQRETTKV